MEKIDILSLDREELTSEICAMGEKSFRAKQIYDWLHVKKVTEFSQMSNLSAQFREELSRKFCLKSLNIKKRLVSRIDNTVKYLYGLSDGEAVETVLMEYKHGNSLCISTQVGCKMGCRFCASTIAGWVRNLAPSEMLLQIYESERDSGRTVNSIVLMGIGEPLDNFDSVVKFLRILNSEGSGMSLRHLSLSTCGVVDGIYRLAELKLGVTLSISLHAATDEKRSAIMPINNRYNLAELISLLGGKNCHVNLIPINEIKEREFKKSRYVELFQKKLLGAGINATIRRTLGADINAACGQLRRDDRTDN